MAIVSIDVGGTFVDACCLYERDGRQQLAWSKEPSTPGNPIRGVVAAVDRILRQAGVEKSQLSCILHGTTVATNAVLERKGGHIGVLMTEGFEHTLELGRGFRSDNYELRSQVETPVFLAAANRRRPVKERIAATGEIIRPLDEEAVRASVRDLVEREKIEALAVCLLFSFVNPEHELRVAEIVSSLYPDLPISLSHVVDPNFREYERVCLTAFDAYLRPVVSAYLGNLRKELERSGALVPVFTMQSRGGLASSLTVVERPYTTLLSGPAAGVVGALPIIQSAGFDNAVTLDIGGTSADIALVAAGKPLTTSSGKFERYPLRTPMIDLSTLGAGGGSIAQVDGAGVLRVGPTSAGSDPGPACYGRGGTEATVTDASVVLGYLSSDYFAGDIKVDVDAAWRAVERVGKRLGLSTPATAAGILRIMTAKIADGIRLASLRKGYDPRDLALVLFGGGGPVVGAAVAAEMGISTALVPFAPGALCAYGLLASAVELDAVKVLKSKVAETSADLLEAGYRELSEAGIASLLRDGITRDRISVRRSADMRYVGQSFEIEVPIDADLRDVPETDLIARFHERHRRIYGHATEAAEVEFVCLRTVHSYEVCDLNGPNFVPAGLVAPAPTRPCYFAETGDFVETAIRLRSQLARGERLAGPAVIHQSDSTTVVPPGWSCVVDPNMNLVIELDKA